MGGQAKAKKKSKPKKKDNRGGSGHTLMSPQERMKAKMHEKAKKKTAEKFSVEQLLEKTQECMDNFDFTMAKMFCQRALDIQPTNLTILDMLGNICAELGDMEKAKQVFLKAMELSPDEGHSKYMYLGQVHTGLEAVQYFSKGIKVMLRVLDKQNQEAGDMGAAVMSQEPSVSAKDVSTAFCSIAEIYFTDLCMEEGAADRCKEAIEKALHYDQHNPEALQLMASYLFSIENTEDGRDYLIKSVSSWLPSLQKEEEESPSSAEEPDEEETPQMATEVLEGLLEEDDEVVQVWYLLGWHFYLQLEKPGTAEEDADSLRKSARTNLTKAKKLYVKLHCEDPPMLEHTEQLLGELGGELVADDDNEAGPSIDNIGDDFIQSSDDDEEEEAMEH
ncbi:uncharacterized protein si:dkey-12j5.1 isoform X2 [Hoplias malabaricus]|uniref:uncharacterized protein si:dkey-12j5.1 isoform X2 n=1 Tax=Hoplias malabaricus TaxID=27720 RepID=UPI003462617E